MRALLNWNVPQIHGGKRLVSCISGAGAREWVRKMEGRSLIQKPRPPPLSRLPFLDLAEKMRKWNSVYPNGSRFARSAKPSR